MKKRDSPIPIMGNGIYLDCHDKMIEHGWLLIQNTATNLDYGFPFHKNDNSTVEYHSLYKIRVTHGGIVDLVSLFISIPYIQKPITIQYSSHQYVRDTVYNNFIYHLQIMQFDSLIADK